MKMCMNAKCKIVQQLYYDFAMHHNNANKIKKSIYSHEYAAVYAHVQYIQRGTAMEWQQKNI